MRVPKEYFFADRDPEDFYDDSVFRVTRAAANEDIELFRRLQFKPYEGNENRIPRLPYFFEFLFSAENPFRRHADADVLFVYKHNEPVGVSVVAIDYRLSERYGKRLGIFGFFELLDLSAGKVLIEAMERRFRDKNVEEIRGPINLSMEYNAGFLLYPHDKPAPVMVNYTRPEYPRLFEEQGYEKLIDLLGLTIDLRSLPENAFDKAQRVLSSKEYEFRNVRKKSREEDLKIILEIVLDAFKDHRAFAKKDAEDLRYSFYPFKDLLEEKMARIAYKDGEPIGFTIRVPDYGDVLRKLKNSLREGKFGIKEMLKFARYSRKIRRGKTIATGVKEGFRRRGIGNTLNFLAVQRMLEKKYVELDYSRITEENEASINNGKKLGGKETKRWRVYVKRL